MRLRLVFAMVASILLLSAGLALSQDLILDEGFDDPVLAGWDVSDAVVDDGSLRMSAGGHAFHTIPAEDFTVTVRLRLTGTAHALVHYRSGEAGNYAVRVGDGFVALQRHFGTVDEIAHTAAPVVPSEWLELGITVAGDNHTVRLDGETVIDLSDPEEFRGEAVGLRVEVGDSVDFDRVAVTGTSTTATTAGATDVGAEGLVWVRTGGPLGGLGYDVRMHPDNPDLMYVTDAFAGVFISENGGKTWAPSNEGITTRTGPSGDGIPVFTLTIDENNPDIIWVGTQNTRGIFRSDDGGRTWVQKDNGVVESEGITFRGFAVDPADSNVVYAAGEIASYAWSDEPVHGREFDMTRGVVYKTVDGGENWTAVWRGENLARYVWIDPTDTDVVYVSTGIFDREAANSDPVAGTPGGEGILKSTDGGATWNRINEGLGNLYVGTLFMHPENPDVLLAGTGSNQYGEGAGVYLSTDGGATWTRTLDSGAHSVEISLSNPDVAYAANTGFVYRSEDGGRTWRQVSGDVANWGPPGIVAGFPIDLQVDPRDPNRLFANNYGGGNFVSEDGGSTWAVASSGYTGAQVRSLAADPQEPGRVVAAARSGLFDTADGGTTWSGLLYEPVNTLEWNAVTVDPTDPQHLVAGTNWDADLVVSRDGGATWERTGTDLDAGMGWRVIAFAPSDATVLYAGSGAFVSPGNFDDRLPAAGVYTSRDGGVLWDPANDEVSSTSHVADLAIHPDDPQTAYAATIQNGLLMTRNGGASWVQLVTGASPNVSMLSIAIDPAEPLHLLAGFAPGGIRSSRDGGETWTPASGLIAESAITDIAFDPIDPTTVYAGDLFSGVHRSADGGDTWTPLSAGLRTRAVTALAVTADARHIYAATDGEGVFRLDLAGAPPPASVSPEPHDDELATPESTTPESSEAPTTTVLTAARDDDGGSGGVSVAVTAGVLTVVLLAAAGGAALWLQRKR